MKRYKLLKKVTSLVIVFIMIYLNFSLDFTALWDNGKQFIHVGPQQAYAATLTYNLPIGEDCSMSGSSNTNDPAALVVSGDWDSKSYLKPDLTNSQNFPFQYDDITSAYLYVYCYSAADVNQFSIYRVTSSWSESQSYNNNPSLASTAVPGAGPYPMFFNDNLGWKAISIRDDLYNMLQNPTAYPNNGWAYIGNWGSQCFYSSEYSDTTKRPYIKVSYNKKPAITAYSPANNAVFSGKSVVLPSMSVSDANDYGQYDFLRCYYYIDNETTERQEGFIQGTGVYTPQTYTFSAMNMGSLSEGNHKMKFVVKDANDGNFGCNGSSSVTVDFKVDKTPPSTPSMTITPDITGFTVLGSASDAFLGLHTTPYMYTVATTSSSWLAAGTPYTITGLTPNTSYTIQCTSRDAVSNTSAAIQTRFTKADVPNISVTTPTSFSLDVSTSDRNPSLTKYRIRVTDPQNVIQYVTQEGSLTQASDTWVVIPGKKITINGLVPLTNYRIEMMAKNEEGDQTSWSAPVSKSTTMAPPGIPQNITARSTNNTITLTWDPIETTDNYQVEINGNTIKDSSFTSYTHTGLGAAIQVTYRVRAVNAGGPGPWSAQITKSTLTNAPSYPPNIRAAANNTSIIITWDAAPGATGYDIEADGIIINNGSSTNYVHGGLLPGTLHSYRVRSINAGGKSEWSDELQISTLSDKPVIPANLKATPGKTQISVSWDGNAGETYDIEVDGSIHNNGTSSVYVHSGLTSNTMHKYRVRSNKAGISSDWSSLLSSTTLANVFGTPGNIKADPADNMVELSWDAVADATGYDVEVDGVILDNDDSINCIHIGLTQGSQHTYRIRAKKADLDSEWSELITVTTYMLPTPQNLTAVTSQTSISLNWSASNGAAGYEVSMDGAITKNIIGTSYTYNGLVPGSQHVFKVRAAKQGENSAWSRALTKSTLTSSFSKPDLAAINRKTSVTIMWNEIEGATSYDVDVDGTVIQNLTALKYAHNSLTPGSIHVYKVRANKGQTNGDWSEDLAVTTLPTGPVTPTNVEVSSATNRIYITWDSMPNVTEYEIEADGEIISVGTGTEYMHTGLLPDSQHTYRVRSINASVPSAWSTPVIIKTKNSTRSYTVDSTLNETFSLIFTATNLDDPSMYTFTVSYDANQLDVIDLCASTAKIDTVSGNIVGSDIKIIQFTPGTIVFKKINTGNEGQSWSGVVNSIKFKSKIDGDSTLQYSIN